MAFFELLAMALDTMPSIGRGMLLALLLSIALFGVARAIAQHPSTAMQLYYRKAAIAVLALVPLLVTFMGLQMPVYVAEAQYFSTSLPARIANSLAMGWLFGVLWGLARLTLDFRRTRSAFYQGTEACADNEQLVKRVAHWRQRLALRTDLSFVMGGSTRVAQLSNTVRLPEAARHWPVGQLDVALLMSLAQQQQRGWRWLLLSQLISILYWPLPWVRKLFLRLPELVLKNALPLAAAAYRDPEGWWRDYKKLQERSASLAEPKLDPSLVLSGEMPLRIVEDAVPEEHARTWQAAKERRAARYFDPYERVYWLVAVASVVVSIGTTLTIRQASPGFEPGFLNVRWQDQMGRRMSDSEGPGDVQKRSARDSVRSQDEP